MANQLSEYRARKGYTYEELATEVSEKLGKPISVQGARLYCARKKIPPAWAAALGLDAEPPAEEVSGSSTHPENGPDLGRVRSESEPPKPPDSAHVAPIVAPKSGDFAFVQGRIAQCYNLAGAGVSMVSGNDGYAVVFAEYSPYIAEAWIKAADEGSGIAKKVVELAKAGGATGELVSAHLILIGGILYVGDKAPAPVAAALEKAYGGKLRPQRDATVADKLAREANRLAKEAENNGSGHFDSAGAMGDFAQ